MKLHRRRQARPADRYLDSLAAIARMEMQLDTGDWRETTRQMHDLLDQIGKQNQARESEIDLLLEQMRRRIDRLECVIARREREYDQLQEQVCVLRDRSYSAGFEAGRAQL